MEKTQTVMVEQIVRAYEVMFITKPFEDDNADHVIEKYEKLLTKNNATVERTDRWGKKRLAYEIQDLNYGIYVLITFNAVAEAVKELDRVMRIDEDVLRHMIIRKGE